MPLKSRQLEWSGCLNVRHLGGLIAREGSLTASLALIRADNLSRLTLEGQKSVLSSNVSAIVDLRSDYELDIEANPFTEQPLYHHCPLFDESDRQVMESVYAAPNLGEMYQVILERFKPQLKVIFEVMADASKGSVVIHCHAGKDRTGLIVALALRLVGVSTDVIAEDYALSDEYLQPLYRELLAQKTNPAERAALEVQLSSQPTFIRAALKHVETRYGSARNYLLACGVGEMVLERLEARILC